MKQCSKHDEGLAQVVRRLIGSNTRYNVILREDKFKDTINHTVGEADFIAYKTTLNKDYLVIGEFKSNSTYTGHRKAVKQLYKAKDYYENHVMYKKSRIFLMYITKVGDQFKYYWIK